MGNDCCKKRDPNGSRALKKFESSLGFKGMRGVVWCERLEKEKMTSNILTKVKIKEICKDLSVNFCKHQMFLQMFRDGRAKGSYNSQLLSTLGIILTEKSDTTKLGILWKHYADLKLGILTENGLLLLIKNIIQIFLDFIPNYVKKEMKASKPEFTDYCFKLMLVKIQLADELFGILKGTQMDEKSFFNKFVSESGKKLMRPNKLRKFAFMFEQKLEDKESNVRMSILFADEFKEDNYFTSAKESEINLDLGKKEEKGVSINEKGMENHKNCIKSNKESGIKGLKVKSSDKSLKILSNLNCLDVTSSVLENPKNSQFLVKSIK